MATLQIREEFTDATRGARYGETEWYTPFTDSKARLFRSLQREYGRCISKVYMEKIDGEAVASCGWYFEKRMEYENSSRYGRKPQYYIRGVWVMYRYVPEPSESEEEETDWHSPAVIPAYLMR